MLGRWQRKRRKQQHSIANVCLQLCFQLLTTSLQLLHLSQVEPNQSSDLGLFTSELYAWYAPGRGNTQSHARAQLVRALAVCAHCHPATTCKSQLTPKPAMLLSLACTLLSLLSRTIKFPPSTVKIRDSAFFAQFFHTKMSTVRHHCEVPVTPSQSIFPL